jgi:elongation factor 1 alpha-like protein
MSRHRNVKQLIDEDYDDYYDDDDDYYDDDDYKPAPPRVAPTPAAKKKSPKPPSTPSLKTPSTHNKAATGTPKKQQSQQQPKAQKNASASSQTNPSYMGGKEPDHKTQLDAKSVSFQATSASQNSIKSNNHNNNCPQSVPEPCPPPEILESMSCISSKNATKKTPLTIVVLGHVDAGKSTIAGRLVMGRKQQQQQQNQRRRNRGKNNNSKGTDKFDYAWVLDEEGTERVHGNTMEVGVKSLDESLFTNFRIVLQDAPGHSDYVPAAITGMAAADAAVLVVDATADSESASGGGGGQLREHVLLAKALGIQQVIVILNKMDVLGWDNEHAYRSKEARLVAFLTGKAVGFHRYHVRCIPASGMTGTNILNNADDNDNDDETRVLRTWYGNGPTLVQALDQLESPLLQQEKLLSMPFRMIVTDVQSESGSLVAVRAKVAQGWVQQGEKLVVANVGDEITLAKISSLHRPDGMNRNNKQSDTADDESCVNVEVKNLQQQQPQPQYCVVGELVDCSLSGITTTARISTGSILSRRTNRPPLSSQCRARILVLGDRLSVPLIQGAHVIFHMHHLDVPCHLSALLRTIQADGSTLKARPRALSRNCLAVVELKLASPVCMESFADCQALGRFVLRRSGDSIAVGRIEEVFVDR